MSILIGFTFYTYIVYRWGKRHGRLEHSRDDADGFSELPWEVIREIPGSAANIAGPFNRPDGSVTVVTGPVSAQSARVQEHAQGETEGRARPGPNLTSTLR